MFHLINIPLFDYSVEALCYFASDHSIPIMRTSLFPSIHSYQTYLQYKYNAMPISLKFIGFPSLVQWYIRVGCWPVKSWKITECFNSNINLKIKFNVANHNIGHKNIRKNFIWQRSLFQHKIQFWLRLLPAVPLCFPLYYPMFVFIKSVLIFSCCVHNNSWCYHLILILYMLLVT